MLVTFTSGYWFRGIIEIYNMQGRLVNKLPVEVTSGHNNMSLNLSHMKSESIYWQLKTTIINQWEPRLIKR